MKARAASFLVPVLIAVVLLYGVLGSLQISVLNGAALLVIGVTMAIAAAAGLLAAAVPGVVRVAVLAGCTLLLLDVTLHLPRLFEQGEVARRDRQRVRDIRRIQAALNEYIARNGPLLAPGEYGEATGPDNYFKGFWDVSSQDGNGNGKPFLEFLVNGGILPSVPVDPVNKAPDGDPRSGMQYVFFVALPGVQYAGGPCDAAPKRAHYLLAITDLETSTVRPPARFEGSGCECLWRDRPDFFQQEFDYVVCGAFSR